MLASIASTIVIIIGFGVLIFVHELGHFLAAKWAGIRTEAFAIGMGPVVVSWRKGVGFALGSTDAKVRAKTGHSARALTDEGLAKFGVGETEYSLRWLPIGGFVKMLGQEDANPNAVSNDPRSYTECSIFKRMVVVSAGVVMNILLALIIFIITFTAGVELEAPVVGSVGPGSPAATATATNAADAGVTEPGLMPGDRIIRADGDDTQTFADVTIATAMGRLDVPVQLDVARPGVEDVLHFSITPVKSGGMLQIGVAPSSSLTVEDGSAELNKNIEKYIDRFAPNSGVVPGATMRAVDGTALSMFADYRRLVTQAAGAPLSTSWVLPNGTEIEVPVQPTRALVTQRFSDEDGVGVDPGALGLRPLIEVITLTEMSKNREVIQPGDIIIGLGDESRYPLTSELIDWAGQNRGSEQTMTVLRGGEEMSLPVTLDSQGKLGIMMTSALTHNLMGPVIQKRITSLNDDGTVASEVPTLLAEYDIMPGSRLQSINDVATADWDGIMGALYVHAQRALAEDAPVPITLRLELPANGPDGAPLEEMVTLDLTPDAAQTIVDAGWTSPFHELAARRAFGPGYVLEKGETLTESIAMGFHETRNLVYLTYLTIDRLVRGTVGINQLRGPVGIIDLGTQVLPRGFMYFLLLLGMISVNLAVINFLPLPIVDGGLFLFLLYEKFTGKPPSIGFQNVATIIGLLLIGTLFVVTLYNDLARLILP